MLVSTAHTCGYKTGAKRTFTYGFYCKSACSIVASGHHVSNDGMLAPSEDVKCTVLAGADGAKKTVDCLKWTACF